MTQESEAEHIGLKFEYEPSKQDDEPYCYTREEPSTEVHTVVEVRDGEVVTVREDDGSGRHHSWPPKPWEHDRASVLERGADE